MIDALTMFARGLMMYMMVCDRVDEGDDMLSEFAIGVDDMNGGLTVFAIGLVM